MLYWRTTKFDTCVFAGDTHGSFFPRLAAKESCELTESLLEISSSHPSTRPRRVVKISYTKPRSKFDRLGPQEKHTGNSITTQKKVRVIIISIIL